MIFRRQDGFTRKIIFAIMPLLACALFAGCAVKKTPKVYRIGILSGLDFFATTADGFKAKMTELGYIEGKNIVYDVYKTNYEPATEKRVLEKFLADKVDLILTFPTEVSLVAKATVEGTAVPVVFANANIEGVDLVKSLRAPGGNITGVRFPGPDIAIKRFELLLELAPKAKRIWVPYHREYPIIASQFEVLRPEAVARGVSLVETAATNAADLQAFLATNIAIDAILMIPEPLAVTPDAFEVICKFAMAHKLPIGGALHEGNGYKSIFGVSSDNIAVGRQAASMADKIFKGVPAGDIPVVSAETFIQVNTEAARQFGVTVPVIVLNQANEIMR